MLTYFVDSYYYIALCNPRDADHTRLTAFHRKLAAKTVTTQPILFEVCDAFARTPHRRRAAEMVKILSSHSATQIVTPSEFQWIRTLGLYADRPDKAWSLTNCLSFVVMQEMNITAALTADHHFQQAGYEALFL